MIKAVVFDLDNTVYDYDYCHIRAMKKLQDTACKRYSLTEREFINLFDEARNEVKGLLENTGASHNRMLYMQLFLEKIGHKSCDGALELYDVYWNSMLSDMKLFDYVLPLMNELKKKDIQIGVLTDLTAHIQHRKIRSLKLCDYVDTFVSSEEVGQEKPSAKAFERLLNKLECKASETIMLGDSAKKDVEGAKAFGMHALLFTRSQSKVMDKIVLEYIDDTVV